MNQNSLVIVFKLEPNLFYETYTARRPPKSHRQRRNDRVCYCVTLFAASAFHSVAAGGDASAQRVFVPGDLDP